MFRLTIEMPPHIIERDHADREQARADLIDHLKNHGLTHQTLTASWNYTSYRIAERGSARIEEICGCEHVQDDHSDMGCAYTTFDHGRLVPCRCPRYAPVLDDPALFGTDHLVPSVSREPT